MAVKGKELNKAKQLDMKIIVGIIVFIVAYIIFQNTVMSTLIPSQTAQLIFNIVVLIILIGLFVYVLVRQWQVYLLSLTNKEFEIDKKGLARGKCILCIPTSSFLGLKKFENYDEATAGKPQNCVIASLKDKDTFVLIYKEGKEKKSVKFQCSVKFYNELKQLVLLNQKNTEKENKKKK